MMTVEQAIQRLRFYPQTAVIQGVKDFHFDPETDMKAVNVVSVDEIGEGDMVSNAGVGTGKVIKSPRGNRDHPVAAGK